MNGQTDTDILIDIDILIKLNRQTGRWMDKQTDRMIDRWTIKEKHGWPDRMMSRQADG